MLQVDLLDVEREKLSVHAINHKELVKFIPQSIKSTTQDHLLKRKRRTQAGAGNEIRTRDTKLGKLVLYQLSYARPLKI